jgi:hypothetical protein
MCKRYENEINIKINVVLYYVLKNTLFLKLVFQKFLCGNTKRWHMSYYVKITQPDWLRKIQHVLQNKGITDVIL